MLPFSTSDRRIFLSLLACLCLLPSVRHARAQEQQGAAAKDDEEVVRISAELVQTDVMVFDRAGKFVDGLGPEQFELLVDGKPQAISFFERIKAGTVDEDAQLAAARGGGRSPGAKGGASLPLDRGRTVFFFVDDLHLSPGSSSRIRKTLLKFIEDELGQNDEAAVTSASGQVGFLQQLTDEKAVLRAAIERLNARPLSVRDHQSPPMTEAQALAIDRSDSVVFNYFVDAVLRDSPLLQRQVAESMVSTRARAMLQQSSNIALRTLLSLETVVRGTAPVAGRKILFFVSDGFLLDMRDSKLTDRLRRITDAAARSSVVIYSLDAQGLTSGMPDASSVVAFDPSGQLAGVNSGERSSMQDPLYTLAADTGGRALLNTNALDLAVTRALKETSVYYLLAWRPEGTTDDDRGRAKFRRIEVGVKARPDLKVIVRRGFYNFTPPEASAKKRKDKDVVETPAPPKPTAASGDREMFAALSSQYPRTLLPTSLSLGYVNNEADGMVLTASMELTREAIKLLGRPAVVGEKDRARLDVAGAVVNDQGKIISDFKQELTFPYRMLDDAGRRVMYSYQFRLAPGLYQVRVATRDPLSGRTGSALRWIQIPDVKRGGLSLSSLFLGERTSTQHPDEIKADQLTSSVLMSVDRRFARASWLRFLTFVYNASKGTSGNPDVALQVQVFRDNQPVLTAPLSKLSTEGVADATRIPYMAELSLATFPPGSYVLQLTAIDRPAKTSTSQRVSFVIE